MDELVKLMRDFGFPTAVAAFVLYRVEPALKGLTAALMDLRIELARRGRRPRIRVPRGKHPQRS